MYDDNTEAMGSLEGDFQKLTVGSNASSDIQTCTSYVAQDPEADHSDLAEAPKSKKTATTFTRFTELPFELRTAIFEFACFVPRVVPVERCRIPHSNECRWRTTSPDSEPSLFNTNQEACTIAKKTYQTLQEPIKGMQDVWINPECDILWPLLAKQLCEPGLYDFKFPLRRSSIKLEIKNIAVSLEVWELLLVLRDTDQSPFVLFASIVDTFARAGIKEVTVVLDEESCHTSPHIVFMRPFNPPGFQYMSRTMLFSLSQHSHWDIEHEEWDALGLAFANIIKDHDHDKDLGHALENEGQMRFCRWMNRIAPLTMCNGEDWEPRFVFKEAWSRYPQRR